MVPIFASPAMAANSCSGGMFPNTPGAQSGLKVTCTSDAGTKIDNINIADYPNAAWHRNAARTVAVTTGNNSGTITFAAGAITAADLRRPISGGNIKGGSFIRAVPTATTATLSQTTNATGGGATTAIVEHTNNRILFNANCTTAAASNFSAPVGTALFQAADVGKSVSGGPMATGAKISAFVNANTVTVSPAPTAACAPVNAEVITIGAVKYASGAPGALPVPNTDPNTVELANSTANGQAFTCAGSTLTPTAGAKSAGAIPQPTAAKLKVIVRGTTTVTTTVASAVANTSWTLANPCPAGITATAGTATIGEAGANAPSNGAAFATLGAELNLNPALVATIDNCNKNTFEGFEVVGAWNNPGAYAGGVVLGAPPIVSTSQVLFPTAVVSFAAYIRQRPTGTGLQPGAHAEFVFPTLPTTLAVCLNAAVPPAPANPTALAFGLDPTTLTTTPALPTGGGNPGDPPIRGLGPQTGAQVGHYQLKNGAVVVNTGGVTTLTTCTIPVNTATPGFACGDG
jgi:hypothetical protein